MRKKSRRYCCSLKKRRPSCKKKCRSIPCKNIIYRSIRRNKKSTRKQSPGSRPRPGNNASVNTYHERIANIEKQLGKLLTEMNKTNMTSKEIVQLFSSLAKKVQDIPTLDKIGIDVSDFLF